MYISQEGLVSTSIACLISLFFHPFPCLSTSGDRGLKLRKTIENRRLKNEIIAEVYTEQQHECKYVL